MLFHLKFCRKLTKLIELIELILVILLLTSEVYFFKDTSVLKTNILNAMICHLRNFERFSKPIFIGNIFCLNSFKLATFEIWAMTFQYLVTRIIKILN